MTEAADQGSSTVNRKRTSEVLRGLATNGSNDRLSIGDIETALGERSFGIILMVLSLLGMLPGISMISAVALLPVCLQMILGAEKPWLPSWMQQRSAKRSDFAAITSRLVPHLERLEHFLRPRYRFMSERGAERLVGAVCLILALFLLPPLPIPFSNIPFAISIAILALAIIERDGLLLTVGLISAALLVGGTLILGWVALQEALLWAAKYLGM